jgi:tetratricopeptide (TPR) repeat protein
LQWVAAVMGRAIEINTDVDLLGPLMITIGKVYWSRGSLESAECMYLEGLGHFRRVHPDKHPDIAKVFGNLAAIKIKQGKFDEAVLLETKSLKIFRRTLGANHHYVASSLNNLGIIKKCQGHVVEATVLFEQAVSMHTTCSTVGAENSDLAGSLYNLARLQVMGPDPVDVENAFASIKEAHRIYTRLGLSHGNAKAVVDMMHRLELYFRQTGES